MDKSTSAGTSAIANDAIVKLQAFCRGCMTRQKVSNMIAEIIVELEQAVQSETVEFAPLTGEDGNGDPTTPTIHSQNHASAALDTSERSIVTASSSSSLDEQHLNDYLQHLIHEEQEQKQADDDDNAKYTDKKNDKYNALDFENSMEFDTENDQDQLHPPGQSLSPGAPESKGTIDGKIERYLQSPKKSIQRSVAKDVMVKRGSVQAATSLFSAPPLHDNTFTVTPKKPKKPWTPSASKPSPRLSSSSIMDKVHIFSQSLPMMDMSDDDVAGAATAKSPRKKRGSTGVNHDTAKSARKALAGRHRLLKKAATIIQARARGYLVRKFDLKAMNKVMTYVREYQSLGLGLNQEDDDMPLPLEPESDNVPDPMDSTEDPIPEPQVEELEKAWSVLQHNRASQSHSQDSEDMDAPLDELPQPIKVKEILSTWEWLKAKQRAAPGTYQKQTPPPSSPPLVSPKAPPSSQMQPQQIPIDESEPSTSASPSFLDGPSDIGSLNASPYASANKTSSSAASETTLTLPPSANKDTSPSLPTDSAEQPFSARISDTAPPRTGDLVALYSWLEQNRLYRTLPNSTTTPPRRDAAAEIKQAKLNAMMTKDNSLSVDQEPNLPLQSTSTEQQPLSKSSSKNELESSASIQETTKTGPTTTTTDTGHTNIDNQSNAHSLESTTSVQQPQNPNVPIDEQQQEIDTSAVKTESSTTLQEDPTTEPILKADATTYPHASPTSTVYKEQNHMEATIAAIATQLESLASATGPSNDKQWNSSEQLMLRKIKDMIQTGKVNFDEIFELWTWLEMNDFDMTKFKKRAVELGIVDPSITGVTTRSNNSSTNRLDGLPPSPQGGSVQSSIRANIQQIEHKVQQHGFVPHQNTPTARPGPIRNHVEYVNEDLSAIYRPQTNTAKKLAQNWWSNVYVQADAKPVHPDDSINTSDQTFSGDSNNRRIHGDEARGSSPITYLDEDLSNVYNNQMGRARDHSQLQGSGQNDNVMKQAMVGDHSSQQSVEHSGSKIKEEQRPSSHIIYLDEDLSNVYENEMGGPRENSKKNSERKPELQGSGQIDRVMKQTMVSNRSSPRSLEHSGSKIKEEQRPSSHIIYLDEDLSIVYKNKMGGARDQSTTNSERKTERQGSGLHDSVMKETIVGDHSSQRSLDHSGSKIKEEQRPSSHIIYLDEDLSNVYQQGIGEKAPGNKASEHTPVPHRPELPTTGASKGTIEYLDEDLSRVYTTNSKQDSDRARPSLQAMVSYWEFSKLNNAGDNDIQDENDEAQPEARADHPIQTNNNPSWQTNPYSNRMLNTLKWLEKQGVDLDKVKATDENSDSLTDSTDDLELSASELENNAVKAATLKEQDLTKTTDWLMKHGHMKRNSTSRSSTSGLQTLSSNADTSVRSDESTVDAVDVAPAVGETPRRQTKSDLTVALGWLKRHSYQPTGRRSSIAESNDPAPFRAQSSPTEDPRSGNQTKRSAGAGTDATDKKSREPLYDKDVLFSLSWLQKHGFDLDKSIHAETKRDSLPSGRQKVETSQAAESQQAPTIDSLMEALSTINDDENTQGIASKDKNNSFGRAKTPSKTSPQDVENALKWLAARGIGKPKKKRAKKVSEASSNERKLTGKTTSGEIPSTLTAATTERNKVDQKADKINLSTNEMSSALKWLNRKGIATTTSINPAKSSTPKSPVKSPKSKRNTKDLTNVDTKKILDIMKTQGTFSQNQRLSQEDVEQTLRFLKLQDSKNANKAPIHLEAKQPEARNTKKTEKDLAAVSKKESKANRVPKKELSLDSDKKNSLKKVPVPGAKSRNTSLPLPPSSGISRSYDDSSTMTKRDSIDMALDKPETVKKSNSRSFKTRSASPGPRKNSTKTRNAKEMRSKSGDFIGDMSASPKKPKQSTSSTADMQKTLKWLQTKASMASPLKTPKSSVQSQLSSKDWKNKIPSLAPLDADDQPSSRAQLPPLPLKKKAEKRQLEAKAVEDYHNALKFLNSNTADGLEDASYFKKLDNTLPKRPGESRESRAKEMARALAWVKKQGLFDDASKSSKKSESLGKTATRPSVNDTKLIFEKKAVIDIPEDASKNQIESKVQSERKKLSSIKDMTQQVMQRRRESIEKMMATTSVPGVKRTSTSSSSDLDGQDFENALKFVLTRRAGGDVTGIMDAIHFKKLDNMLPLKDDQSSKDRAREMVKMLEWLRKKGRA